jgi:hypothetical protein
MHGARKLQTDETAPGLEDASNFPERLIEVPDVPHAKSGRGGIEGVAPKSQ